MAQDIKYRYAFDKTIGKVVDILTDVTEECRGTHEYVCLGCGHEMKFALCKNRTNYFSHKSEQSCDGETYLHKLAKKMIKQKFDSSNEFRIRYQVNKSCNNESCKMRNVFCSKRDVWEEIDLKQNYDTCSEESPVNGFIADLLLSNSQNPKLEPILIEICVTHPCEEEKIKSGLKIIEIPVKSEDDLIQLCKHFTLNNCLDKAIRFISFDQDLQVSFQCKIDRYIYDSFTKEIGHTRIPCNVAKRRLLKDSSFEFNVAPIMNQYISTESVSFDWLCKNKHLRRCYFCKFYYATQYEEKAKCRLSQKYGTPMYPDMKNAEYCRSFWHEDNQSSFLNDEKNFYIEEITGHDTEKETYRVIIAGSSSFDDYTIFKSKCDHYLSSKIYSHNIILLSGTAKKTRDMIERYAEQMGFIVETFDANWNAYGQDAILRVQNEMLSYADALMAFYPDGGRYTQTLIDSAVSKGIPVRKITLA